MNRSGYTLREVVIVGAVVLVALLLIGPLLLQQRAKSRRNSCEYRQIKTANAIFAYEGIQGGFPGYRSVQSVDESGAKRPIGWAFQILPFLDVRPDSEETGPWRSITEDFGGGGPNAGRTPETRIPTLICSSMSSEAISRSQLHWVVNAGMPDADREPRDWPANGIFHDGLSNRAPRVTRQYLNDHDGAASTLLLSENVDAGNWTAGAEPLVGFVWVDNFVDGTPAPGDQLLAVNALRGEGDGSPRFARLSSFHEGGVNVVYADGRSTFLSERIEYLVLAQLMAPDSERVKKPGGETPVAPPYRLIPTPAGELADPSKSKP